MLGTEYQAGEKKIIYAPSHVLNKEEGMNQQGGVGNSFKI